MNHIDNYVELIRDELGFALCGDALDRHFDELEGWDSMYLLALVTAVEALTGARVSVADVLRARSLREVYDVVAA